MNYLFKRLQEFLLGSTSIIVIVFCIFYSSNVTSQVVQYKHPFYNITTAQGLPSLETYSVRQDSKGYIWICTDAGVCRYDGFEYKTFTTKDGLTDNVVFDTYEDFKGRIWFTTYNSMLCYYENGRIIEYKYNAQISRIIQGKMPYQKEIWLDSQDNLYYELYSAGIVKISKNGILKQLNPVQNKNIILKINNRKVLSFVYVNENKSSNDTLYSLNASGDETIIDFNIITTHYSYPNGKENLDNNYFLFGDKLYDLKNQKVLFQSHGLYNLVIKDSVFWISSSKGLLRAKLINNQLEMLPSVLSKHAVSSVYFNKENGAWISTLDAGVFYVQNLSVLDEMNYQKDNSMTDISSLCKLNNEFIVGTSSGKIASTKGIFKIEQNYPLAGKVKFVPFNNHLFISNGCVTDYKVHEGVLGNYFYNWVSQIVAQNNKVYFLHDSQVFLYEKNKSGINGKRIYHGAADLSKNNQLRLLFITVSKNGDVIVATKNELFHLKDEKLKSIALTLGKQIDISFIDNDPFWGIIIGTTGDGVFTIKDNKLRRFNEINGLLNDRVNTLDVGQDGSIYVGMPNGISVIKKNGKIGRFNQNYTMEVLDVNVIYCDSNEVYFGTKTGLLKLSYSLLNECFKQKNDYTIFLQSIKYDENLEKANKVIDFPAASVMLQLNFSVFQFNNWFSKNFQYRIGSNGSWVNIESPSISLYRPSGNFEVFVRYTDIQNNWSNPALLCTVNVKMPFWKRWYFWTLISFVALLIAFLFYQRTQKRIHDKHEFANQLLSLEQQIQNARMNPHFIFNVLNSIHSYVLSEEIEKADSYLMKFSKLMREILMSSKEGIITLKQECSILNKYLELEQLRHQNAFVYEIDIINVKNINCSIPSMMIQPFVENAVLYSQKRTNNERSKIKIQFALQNEDYLHVIITNSGVLSEESLEKMNLTNTKNAIGITRSRLENYKKLLNTDVFGIDVKIINKTLTSIDLIIPIMEKSEQDKTPLKQ